jgi:Uma2 family endonuclease
MVKQSCRLGLFIILMAFLSASRGEAILNCTDCGHCSFSCNQQCFTDTGSSTCGAVTSFCIGDPSCVGGCLTTNQADFILGLLDQERPRATPETQEKGRAAARLTWRLTQYAEESGLGEVYTGGTGFRRSTGPRGVASPDLAFVSRARLETRRSGEGVWPGTPDLVVQFASSRAGDDAAAWLAGGIRAVLVLDPATRTMKVYRSGSPLQVLGAESVLEIPDLLPGWSLRVGDLFQ